jgi:phosphinothricin acetyltransferase
MTIEPMRPEHADAVIAIYQAGLDTDNASFETTAPDWNTWDSNHLDGHRFVAIDDDGQVIGWVAAGAVSTRCVYAGVIEHSVYVHPDAQGQGVGRKLLEELIGSAEASGVWTIETGIFPENAASLALHEAVGFRVVGRREGIGQHHGRWRDTLLLERRSQAMTTEVP